MPTNTESVRLFVGGLVHDDWDSYEVDSDLLIPADAWRVSLTLRERNLRSVANGRVQRFKRLSVFHNAVA